MKRLTDLSSKHNLIKVLFLLAVIFIIGFVFTFITTKVWIRHNAIVVAKEVSAVFQKDKVESLLEVIESKNYTLKEKNQAIWALGVLKDKRALPKLEDLYTEKKCNHDKELCQYEVQKAILKIKGKFHGSWQAGR